MCLSIAGAFKGGEVSGEIGRNVLFGGEATGMPYIFFEGLGGGAVTVEITGSGACGFDGRGLFVVAMFELEIGGFERGMTGLTIGGFCGELEGVGLVTDTGGVCGELDCVGVVTDTGGFCGELEGVGVVTDTGATGTG